MQKPSLMQRVQLALRVYREGLPQHQKAAPFLWPAWRGDTPQWQIVNFDSYVDEGFNQNSLIYSAIMYKVRSGTAAPLKAYGGDLDHPEPLPEGHPLAQLVARPNPHQSWTEMHSQSIVYLNISGNCYTFLDRPARGGLPEAMWNLRPDRVYIIPDNRRGIRGYLYVPEGKSAQDGIPILPEDMMHVKLPNPMDDLEGMGYGLSPISPLARSGDVDNKITEFLKLFFDRGTMGSFAISFDVGIDNETAAAVRERWKDTYGGSQNWIEPIALGSGAKVERLNMTFNEMGFEGLDERNETRILGPFGVPPILIGSRVGLSRSTYANYKEARRHFWEDTMVPELRLFETEYQYYLQGEDGSFVLFDTSEVPALREALLETVESWTKLVGLGVPKATASEVVGLNLGDLPDGDISYMPINLVPVGLGIPKPAPRLPAGDGGGSDELVEAEDEAEEEDEGKATTKELKRWTAEQKAAHWKAIDRIATSWEGRFEQAARDSLERDMRSVLAIVSEAQKAALRQKATVDWNQVQIDIREYLESLGAEGWREEFIPLIEGLIEDQGERWKAALGIEFDIRNLFAEAWFQNYMLKFAQPINQTTLDWLSAMLEQAMAEGWSIPDMQKRMESMFRQWMTGDLSAEEFEWFADRLPRYRTEAISRTESLRASNSGSLRLYKEFGAKQKEWFSTADDRTRDDHRIGAAWGFEPLIADVDQAFTVGGEKMQYPHDPNASPGQTVNCRCVVLPYLPDEVGR